jgi:hypothetical protein
VAKKNNAVATLAPSDVATPPTVASPAADVAAAYLEEIKKRPYRVVQSVVDDIIINIGTTSKPSDAGELVVGNAKYAVLTGAGSVEKMLGGSGKGASFTENEWHALIRTLDEQTGMVSVLIPSIMQQADDQGFLKVKRHESDVTRAASELGLAGELKHAKRRKGQGIERKYTAESQIVPGSVKKSLPTKPSTKDLVQARFLLTNTKAEDLDENDPYHRHAMDIRDAYNAHQKVSAALGTVVVKRN